MDYKHRVNEVKKFVYQCIIQGACAEELLKYLYVDGEIIGKESALWDFKYELNSDDTSLSKVIKQISSFYNSYGGYIIYGIEETIKDREFKPVSFDSNKVNPAQLRTLLNNNLDIAIDITVSAATITYDNQSFIITAIHIPQRTKEIGTPAKFIKNAKKNKTDNSAKLEFCEGDVFLRKLDECKKATLSEDWQFLFSDRNLIFTNVNKINISLEHNLPDKKMICADFFGRKNFLSLLWEWLSDPFEYTKILAGDGGKGKTSLAYKFCQEFIESPPFGFERIVWLSAKEKQFSGISNDYFDLRQADFYDFNSFLLTLSDYCALDTEDLENTSTQGIKTKLRAALPVFPSLIIVDNVDSLQNNDQLLIVDACRQFGQNNIRFLITTRNRFSYSDDSCIPITGLERKDYDDFIKSSSEKYKLNIPKPKQIELIYNATDGSPLLTQSILRLCKLGDNFESAVLEWKGQAGEDARNAALLREIMSLDFDAKKVILCIFYFDSCSKSELEQACGFAKIKLNDALQQLQSLFLVNAPKFIDNEDRFSISNTTKLLINGIQSELSTDYLKLKRDITNSRRGINTSARKGNVKRIGLAISQALALMKSKRESEAISTITNELQRQPKNPDLLLAHARCILECDKPNYEEARKLLRESYDNGQDKEILFDFWYNCESSMSSTTGEIEVSKLALSKNKFKEYKWCYYLAKSLAFRSSLRRGADKVNDLIEASTYLSRAIKDSHNSNRDIHKSESNEIHNLIWNILENDSSIGWAASFDYMIKLISHGDIRAFVFKNTHKCILEAESEARNQKSKLHVIRMKERFNRSIMELRKPIPALNDLLFDTTEKF
ncbi:ATP-binding protein [Pantoea sp. SS70]|jgi:hypothetical protein|uniref:AlbA family DNA-binding domain-containing protein n=1 Tax=Pantoea sp. SS70 TaxID=3024247 RepID=UPI002452A41B|nr:ATP-binding protein [Pantoea sp. SS70]WGK56327.1 ATP-binding protein [Pantoea sp. SS70]